MFQNNIRKRQKLIISFILFFTILSFAFVGSLTAATEDATLKKQAGKEGKVTFYTSLSLKEAADMLEKFQKKYPFIKAELNRFGNVKLLNRVLMEHRAQKKVADVYSCKGDAMHVMNKKGILAKYLSPERKYYGEKFKDSEGYWTDSYPTVHSLAYNTRMVSPNEAPATYDDLLNPKWKGKIGINLNNFMWAEIMMQIKGKEAGIEYLRAVARQNPSVRAGSTLNVTLVAAGELAMAVSINANTILRHKAKGAPVERAKLKEPNYGDLHPIALSAKAPHPNAGKLLIDFFLSEEGQKLMDGYWKIPARSGFNPKIGIRAEEIIPLDPALGEKTSYYQNLMREIFTP
jgi:ABC-type Fe3+ transport system substrate-binding protein